MVARKCSRHGSINSQALSKLTLIALLSKIQNKEIILKKKNKKRTTLAIHVITHTKNFIWSHAMLALQVTTRITLRLQRALSSAEPANIAFLLLRSAVSVPLYVYLFSFDNLNNFFLKKSVTFLYINLNYFVVLHYVQSTNP